MKIVTTTRTFPADYPVEKAITRLAHIGFDAADLAIDSLVRNKDNPFMCNKWEDWAKLLKETAQKEGIKLTHSHACGDAASRDEAFLRGFELCRILEIPYTVVHPIWRKSQNEFYQSEDEFLTVNVDNIKPLLELAEKNNVIILSENLLWGASLYPEVISKLVDEVNSPWFGWCFDTGHANISGLHSDSIIGLKQIPLSLHIHDNNGRPWTDSTADEHTVPGNGTINWKEFIETLCKINYTGEFVLEAFRPPLEAKDDDERENLLTEQLERSKEILRFCTSNNTVK